MTLKILLTGIAYDILNSLAVTWANYLMRKYNAILLPETTPIYFESILKIIRGEFLQTPMTLKIRIEREKIEILTITPDDIKKQILKKMNVIVLLVDGDEEDIEFTIRLGKMLGRKRKKKFVLALCEKENKKHFEKILEKVFPNNKMLDYPYEILNMNFEVIEKFENVKKISKAVDVILSKIRK